VKLLRQLLVVPTVKKRHNSCSKQIPSCDQCKKRKLACEYVAPLKRGPKPKEQYVKNLESQVANLSLQVKRQQEVLEYIKTSQISEIDSQQELLTNNAKYTSSIQSPSLSPDTQIHSQHYRHYHNLYRTVIAPHLLHHNPILADTKLVDQVINQQDINYSNYGFDKHIILCNINAALAIGALLSCAPFHAQQLFDEARISAKEFFDNGPNYLLACAYTLMTFNSHKASFYNSTVLRMFDNEEDLLETANHSKRDLIELKITTLMFYAHFHPKELLATCETLYFIGTPRAKITAIELHTQHLLTSVYVNNDKQTTNNNQENVLHAGLQRLYQMEQLIREQPASTSTISSLTYLLACLSYRTAIHWLLNDFMAAKKMADESVLLLNKLLGLQNNYLVSWQVPALQYPTTVHRFLGDFAMVGYDLNQVQRVINGVYLPENFKQLCTDLMNKYNEFKELEQNIIEDEELDAETSSGDKEYAHDCLLGEWLLVN